MKVIIISCIILVALLAPLSKSDPPAPYTVQIVKSENQDVFAHINDKRSFTYASQCGGRGIFQSMRIPGCQMNVPCKLKTGTTLKAEIDFIPAAATKQLRFKVTIRVLGTDSDGDAIVVHNAPIENSEVGPDSKYTLEVSGEAPKELAGHNVQGVYEIINVDDDTFLQLCVISYIDWE